MEYSVLVVDDDDDDFVLLGGHISYCQQDVRLTPAANGLEAIQLLKDGLQPNLILIDAQMPMMDGYELLVWLMGSTNWRHIPVVIWTGGLSESEVKRCYQAGANAIMLKQDALTDIESFCRHWFKLVQLPSQVLAG